MDYKHAAQQVLDCIGGKDNILSAAHCATRLRLVIADNAKLPSGAFLCLLAGEGPRPLFAL